jgi:hypothetical protein
MSKAQTRMKDFVEEFSWMAAAEDAMRTATREQVAEAMHVHER